MSDNQTNQKDNLKLKLPSVRLKQSRSPGYYLKTTSGVIVFLVVLISFFLDDNPSEGIKIDTMLSIAKDLSGIDSSTLETPQISPTDRAIIEKLGQDEYFLNGVQLKITLLQGWKYLNEGNMAILRKNDDGRVCQITSEKNFETKDFLKTTKNSEEAYEKDILLEALKMGIKLQAEKMGLPKDDLFKIKPSAESELLFAERKEKSISYGVKLKTKMTFMGTDSVHGLTVISMAVKNSLMVRLQCANLSSSSDSGNEMTEMARSLKII